MHSTENKKAVILFSGGLDSTTVLAIAKNAGYSCYCLSFQYGQKQTVELEKATRLAKKSQVNKHLILNLDLDKIGGSALTDNIEVPKDRDTDNDVIPVTYVPARNTIFPFPCCCLGRGAWCTGYFYWSQCCGLFRISRLQTGIS